MCPKLLAGVQKDEKATEIIIKYIDLPEDQYRMGNTKVPCKTLMKNTTNNVAIKGLNKNCILSNVQNCQNNCPKAIETKH